MSILNTIRNDYKEAMKARDVIKRDELRSLIGEVEGQLKKDNKGASEDEIVITKIRYFVNNMKETVALRGETDNELAKIAVLEFYLPVQLTAEQMRQIIIDNFGEKLENKDRKDVNIYFKANYPGLYTGGDLKLVIDGLVA